MTTGTDIATYGLKKAGIVGQGRNPSATELTDALADLNDLISQWNTQRWMTWALLDTGFTSTGITTGYTVGVGGNYNLTSRPDRIEAAYVRQNISGGLPVDTPLKIIPAREQYSRIATKSLISFPQAVFYDSSFALGKLFPYPAPTANLYEVHILTKNVAPVIVAATDMANFPAHYIPCMKFNLARVIRQGWGKGRTPDTELNRLATNALDVVKNSNLQIPELAMPTAVINKGAGYNIYNDGYGDT